MCVCVCVCVIACVIGVRACRCVNWVDEVYARSTTLAARPATCTRTETWVCGSDGADS